MISLSTQPKDWMVTHAIALEANAWRADNPVVRSAVAGGGG